MRRNFSLITVLLVMSVMLIACGNGNNEETNADNATEEENNSTSSEQDEASSNTNDENEEGEENEESDESDQIEVSDKTKDFIDDFNDLADNSDDVKKIEEENIEEGPSVSTLYGSAEYEILEIYDVGEDDYYIDVRIAEDQPYKNLQGEGFEALLLAGEALNKDKEKLKENFEGAMDTDGNTYFENENPVVIDNIEGTEAGDDVWGIEVHFK